MPLDFSSFASAIGQLEKSLTFAKSDLAQQNDDLFEQLRNSVIHCFEFTYELSWKMLKRYVVIHLGKDLVQSITGVAA